MANNKFVDQHGRMREGNGQWADDPSRGAAAYDLTGAEERRMEDMRQDPDAYARNFALSATGSYPADDTPRLSGSRNRPGVRLPAAERAKVEIAVIDKREARKRWERGLPIVAWDRKDVSLSDGDEMYADAFTSRQQADGAGFDAVAGETSRNTRFAKPVLTGDLNDTIRQVAPSEVKEGDRIDTDGVGNWKVLSVETGPEGVVTLTMPLGNSTDTGTRLRFLPGPRVVEYVGKDGEVFKTVPGETVPVHESQTDPIVVRERIAEQFPRATFEEGTFDPNERTYWFVDGQTVRATRRPADASVRTLAGYRQDAGITQEMVDTANAHAAAKAEAAQREWDEMRARVVATWQPNTTAADLVRPARRR